MSSRTLVPVPASPASKPALAGTLSRQRVNEGWQSQASDWSDGAHEGTWGGHDGDAAAQNGQTNRRPRATAPTKGKRPQDFSRLRSRVSSTTIHDDDQARAFVTQLLVEELAPMLGIDPSKVEIRVNGSAEVNLNARGTSGAQDEAKVELHPLRFDPLTEPGRYVLGHEMAHAAQRLLPAPKAQLRERAFADAEEEAVQVGRGFSLRRRVAKPRRALARHRVAREADATKAPTPPPLSESVLTSRSREISVIKSELSGLWISDGDVFSVMELLDTMPYPVRVAVVFALGKTARYELADNINPPHVYKHRSSVLACYDALTPGQFDAVDLKVFRALPIAGLTTEETEAAAKTLRNLSDSDRQSLLRSDNGPAIQRIMTAPRPSAAELERLRVSAEKAAAEEAALAEERKAILAHKDDAAAKSLIEEVKFWLSQRTEGNDNHMPNGYDAIQALNRLGVAKKEERSRFLFAAEQLESDGFIDTLLRLLPSGSFFDTPEHTDTLVQLVQSRLPTKNARLIENLLSYGLFDWAIRDYEAMFAYRLIKLMPLSEQYRFRQRDAGKWYLRLIENLPSKDPATKKPFEGLEIRKAASREELREITKGFDKEADKRQVDEKELFYNASVVYSKKLQEQGAKQTLADLIRAFEQAKKGIYRDEEAKSLYRQLVALGGSSLQPGHETRGDQILREALIHELDSRGYIDELFGELPEEFLYAEENRVSTVKIMLARDPARVQRHARELVSRGFTDWMVKDHEAYLAYLCVKALPQDEREGFIKDNADEWGRIQSEMSEAQRQSRDLNLYIGDKAGVDRASVLGQLADGANWTDGNAVLLDGLVRMAIAMTEHRFAFERSKEFKARDQKNLRPLVAKYRLWDPAEGRDKYTPELLQGTRWYEEGIFSSLKTLWSGLVLLWNLDILFIDGKVGAKLDLNDLQDFMGGDVGGAKLGNPKKRGAKEPLPHPDANKISLLLGKDGKSAHVELPELVIDSANVQMASTTFQTGSVTLKGLELDASYDTEQMLQPTEAHVDLASVEASDLLLAKSSSMLTISRLAVKALRLAAGTIDTVTRVQPSAPAAHSVPFPLLVVPLLAMLALFGLPILIYRKIAGILSEGLESNPGERFAADVAQRTKAIKFSFGSLDVEGLTTSGGQHVGHVGVRDFALRIGMNKPTRLRAERFSIDQRLAALEGKNEAADTVEKLKGRRAEITTELVEVEKQETEYVQIQQKIIKGGLKAEEQTRLQKRLDELNFDDKGAAFIDIGSIEASDVRGTLTSREPIRLANIHGEGGGEALTQFVGMPTITDQELSRRSAAGERPVAPLTEGQEGKLSIELGDVHTGELVVSGGIQSVATIDKKIAELEPLKAVPEVAPLYDSLLILRKKAERYEAMVQHGVSALKADELAEFRELRRVLADQASLIIKSIDLTRATLDVNLANGRVDFGAAAARVTGVQLPQKGIQIDEIIARGLGVGAMPAGGLLNWQDWKRYIQNADAKIDFLQASGVRSKYHGLLFEKATLTGAYAKLGNRGDEIEAGLKKFTVEQVGIAPMIGLMHQKLASLKEKARVAEQPTVDKLTREIAALEATITDLEALVNARTAAALQLEAAKTPAEIDAGKKAVADAESAIVLGMAEYGATRVELDEFGVKVTGAGDVITDALGPGIDPLAVLSRGGVRVTGTGPDQQLFKRFAVQGAHASQTPQGDAKVTSATVGSFEIGATKVDISARRDGDSIFIEVPQFSIDSIALNQFLFTSNEGAGGIQMWSDGASGIEAVTFSGSVRLDSSVKGSNDLADFHLAKVHVESARIGRVYGNGLGFALLGEKTQVQIQSGSISGIHAEQFDITWPDDPKASPKFKGKAGIDSIDKLVVGESFAGGWRVGGGRIDAKNLNAEILEDGGIKASVGSLSLTSFSVRGPDGWVRFTLADLGGKFGYKDGVLDVEDFHFGSLKINAFRWNVGEKGFVEGKKPTTVTDLRLKGRLETDLTPGKSTEAGKTESAKPERKIRRLRIDRLHIGKVQSEDLVYQDENNRIELRPADARFEKHMVGFEPLFLQNLDVWGLDWTPTDGVTKGKVSLGSYEASAHYEGLKSGLTAGFALRGTGMSAEMVGPGAFTVDLGKIEKTGGKFDNGKFSTGFATGAIVGKIAMGPDYIEAHDVEIGKAHLSNMLYTDPPKRLTLDAVNIERIKLGRVRQNYRISTDPGTKGEKTPTTVELRDLELFGLLANRFDYKGESRGMVGSGPDAKEEVSTQHIKGNSAHISHLKVSAFDHDAIKRTGSASFTVDTAPGAKPGTKPFGIQGLSAELVNTIGSETTKTTLLTDVHGGPLTANGIKFATVVLGTAPGPDGKPMEVTRTALDGEFNLTEFGLLNPDLTLTDAKGKTTTIGGYGSSVTIRGIRPKFLPNGAVALPIDEMIAKDLRIKRGNMTVRLPLLELKSIAVGARGMGTEAGLDWLAAKIGEIHVEGASIEIVSEHKAKLTDEEFAAAQKEYEEAQEEEKKNPSGKFIAEPLSTLSGDISGEYSLDYWEDPDITAKIRNGQLDFGDLTNYSVQLHTYNVEREGVTRPEDRITLGNFVDVKTLKDFKRKMPGFYGDAGKYNYGRINFREMVEGLVNEPGSPPQREFEAAEGLRDFIDFSGAVGLGEGRMGRDKDGDGKLGEGDTWVEFKRDSLLQNTFTLKSRSLGHEIELKSHELHMSGAGFTAGKTQAGKTRIGSVGDISLQKMVVKLKGLATFTTVITVELENATIKDVHIGDITFLDPAELGKLAPPTATEVNPKATPGGAP